MLMGISVCTVVGIATTRPELREFVTYFPRDRRVRVKCHDNAVLSHISYLLTGEMAQGKCNEMGVPGVKSNTESLRVARAFPCGQPQTR